MDLREVTEFIKDTFGYILVLVIIIFIFTFIVSIQPIAGNSMHPTLKEGDLVLVSKLTKKYNHNDIIIFKDKENKSYVKRVIGVQDEEVHYLNGLLYINDKTYKETFLTEEIRNASSNFMFVDICDKETCPNEKITKDHYLVLGDNRPNSIDSRDKSIGLVPKEKTDGKVIFRIWPLNKIGTIK